MAKLRGAADHQGGPTVSAQRLLKHARELRVSERGVAGALRKGLRGKWQDEHRHVNTWTYKHPATIRDVMMRALDLPLTLMTMPSVVSERLMFLASSKRAPSVTPVLLTRSLPARSTKTAHTHADTDSIQTVSRAATTPPSNHSARARGDVQSLPRRVRMVFVSRCRMLTSSRA